MFARFRQVRDRLKVSIVETARTDAGVRQSHVASLGSVPLSPSPADRVRFWVRVHQRLATLSNRLDDKTRSAIMAALHARIPIPTAEDQEAAQNAGREANANLFATLRDKHRGLAEVHRQAAEREAAAAEAVDGVEDAHASRPMTPAEARRFLKSLGLTGARLRHSRDLAALCERFGEDQVISMLVREGMEAEDRAIRRATRQLVAVTRRATQP